jgi:hypothetical protein
LQPFSLFLSFFLSFLPLCAYMLPPIHAACFRLAPSLLCLPLSLTLAISLSFYLFSNVCVHAAADPCGVLPS